MPKGNKCPACGKLTFHESGPYFECSSCKAIGWWSTPGAPGGGKGSKCQSCSQQTMHQIYAPGNKNVTITFCSRCKATIIS